MGGVREITLLGQTVNSYEFDGWDFPRLLREAARVEGIRRVRFTSPHPNDFTREWIEASGARNVAELLRQVPGLDVARLGRLVLRLVLRVVREDVGV